MTMPPNVLLVILDSVRARNTSLYGYSEATTPFLESWSEEGTTYRHAHSPGVHSIASHVSIFTGYEVEEHGLTEHGATLDPEQTIWRQLERDYGHDTGLFTPNAVVTRSSNLDEAFGTVEGPRRSDVPYPDALTLDEVEGEGNRIIAFLEGALEHDKTLRSLYNGVSLKIRQNVSHDVEREAASVYTDAFLKWVDGREGPWAACLNLMDAHYPYEPLETYDHWGDDQLHAIHDRFPDGPGIADYLNGDRKWWQVRALEGLYDGCIRQIDATLESLVEDLERRGELEDTFVVVTSDHGECFGEPSHLHPDVRGIGHRYGVFEPLTHVPLLTKRPGQHDGSDVTAPVSLSAFPDAVRRVLDDVDRQPFEIEGRVIVSTERLREDENLTSYVEDPTPYVGPWRAVYEANETRARKYVSHNGESAVVTVRDARTSYREDDIDSDPTTVIAETFEELTSVSIGERRDDVDATVEDHLQDLGYVR